jgi:hypothetical protein
MLKQIVLRSIVSIGIALLVAAPILPSVTGLIGGGG